MKEMKALKKAMLKKSLKNKEYMKKAPALKALGSDKVEEKLSISQQAFLREHKLKKPIVDKIMSKGFKKYMDK